MKFKKFLYLDFLTVISLKNRYKNFIPILLIFILLFKEAKPDNKNINSQNINNLELKEINRSKKILKKDSSKLDKLAKNIISKDIISDTITQDTKKNATEANPDKSKNLNTKVKNKNNINSSKKEFLIPLTFEDKSLLSIINSLVEIKKKNLILPTNPADLNFLNQQLVTFSPDNETFYSLDEAWKLLLTFVDIAGFNLLYKDPKSFEIQRNISPGQIESSLAQDPLPLYVNLKPEKLPDLDKPIRYLGYLKNIKLAQNNAITAIISNLQSYGAPPPLFFEKVNGYLITDKARNIRAILEILNGLDNEGFSEAIEVIPLTNITGAEVASMFKLLQSSQPTVPNMPENISKKNIINFSNDTRIIVEPGHNLVILLGHQTSVNYLKDFIAKYLDHPLESGKSVLHVYDVQYLDAQELAEILNKIINSQFDQPQGQSQQNSGREDYFSGPIAVAEIVKEVEPEIDQSLIAKIKETEQGEFSSAQDAGIQNRIYTGGNRLIIAALPKDWPKIKALIEQLDVKEEQVILEFLFLDFILETDTQFSATTRNPTSPVNPGSYNFLSSNISSPTSVIGTNPSTLAPDLLTVTDPNLITPLIEPGSLIISLNDPVTPGIASIIKVLKSYYDFKIVAHPFLYISNHKKGEIQQKELRRANGPLVPVNGSYTILVENVDAELTIQAVPHVANEKTVKLEIGIEISEFTNNNSTVPVPVANFTSTSGSLVSETSLNRVTAGLNTTAFLKQGQALVLGGLVRKDSTITRTQTPLLGSIPLLGRFFVGEEAKITYNTISLFVTPIIISPKKSKELTEYAVSKIDDIQPELKDDNFFYSDKDPIYNHYFKFENSEYTKRFFKDSNNLNGNKYDNISNKLSEEYKIRTKALPLSPADELKFLLSQEENPLANYKSF